MQGYLALAEDEPQRLRRRGVTLTGIIRRDDMEEKQQEENNQNKKKSKLRILLIILLAVILLILLLLAVVYLKLKGMSRNSVGIVPKTSGGIEILTPEATLVPVLNEDELDLSEDYYIEIDPDDMTEDPIFETNPKDPDVINILMLGSDSRGRDRGRTDSIILVSFNQRTREAKMLSFLRDSWVYIPGRDAWNRINTAYMYGGVGMLINTLNVNFDLDIKYYMKVNFSSLVSITDKLGGIDIELSEKEIEYINKSSTEKLPVEAGWHHLNGEQTLIHARNRRIGNGDWARTERQRNVMMAFLRRAREETSASSLASLVYNLIDDVETNMSPTQLVSLAIDVVLNGELSLNSRPVPFEKTWNYAWEGKMAVIHIDIEANKQMINEYLYEE